MTKTKWVLVTIAVWGAGIGSAAALVKTLTLPLLPKAPVEAVHDLVREAPLPDIDNFKVPGPIATPVIAKVRSHVRPPAKRPKREMRCGEFKSMQIGPVDRGVKYCQ